MTIEQVISEFEAGMLSHEVAKARLVELGYQSDVAEKLLKSLVRWKADDATWSDRSGR